MQETSPNGVAGNPHHIGHIWTCSVSEAVLTVGLHNVAAMAFGREHCLFLTSEGSLFAFGKGSFGQLGLGTQADHPKEPQNVVGIPGKICAIVCGPWHSGVVCSNGSIYMWGLNDSGQCGVAGEIVVLVPTLVKIQDAPISCQNCELPLQKKIAFVQISCGESHTLGLTRDHELWAWGSGSQLGLMNVSRTLPVPVDHLHGKKVLSFSCGVNYSLAVVEARKGSSARSRQRPIQLCPKCKEEEITVTETDDAVIISQDHVCPLGLPLADNSKSSASRNSVENGIKEIKDISLEPRSELSSDACPSYVALENEIEDDAMRLKTEIAAKKLLAQECAANETNVPEIDVTISDTSTKVKNGEKDTGTPNDFKISSSESEDSKNQNQDGLKNQRLNIAFSIPPSIPENDVASTETRERSNTDVPQGSDSDTAGDFDGNEVVGSTGSRQEAFRNRSKSEAHRRYIDAISRQSRPILKRAKSLIDPSTARAFYEKLVGTSTSQLSEERPSSSASSVTTPYVWDLVSKVKSSVDKIPLPSFSKNASQVSAHSGSHSSSQESFEVVESQFIEDLPVSEDSSLQRSESLKLLLEAKCNPKTKAFLRNNSFDNSHKANQKHKKASHVCKQEKHKHSTFQTEVWSWGAGDYSQLGHSDKLERSQPCCIQQLSGQGVMMVLAGANHSIALTRDSRVYTWGRNDRGQLGHSVATPFVSSPKLVEFPHHELVWDIAAGDAHTVFLADHRAPRVALYYCGTHENLDPCSCNKEKGLRQLNILKKSGLVVRVFAGGPYGGCIVNQHGLSELPILHEFSATERWYLYQLQTILGKLMACILKDESLPSDLTPTRYDPLKSLIGQMAHVTEMVAVNTHDLTLTVLNKSHLDSVYMLEHQNEWLECYLLYSQCLCDVMAVGVPTALTKSWSISPNTLKMLARDTLCEVGMDLKSSAEIFQHLIQIPLRRARDYVRLLHHFCTSSHKRVSAMDVSNSSSMWQQLIDVVTYDVKIAEKTKQFWDSASHKLTDAYLSPSRRLVCDSKKQPIHLQSSGRFSAHNFILFNDLLVHSHFSGTQSFALQTVWVEPLPDSDNLQNAFVLTMPEDTLTLTCATSSQKTEWVCALNLAIRQSLGMDRDLLSRLRSNSGSRRLSPPLPRQASYTFTRGLHFKDATYNGSWLCGKLHGQGTMTWPDGRKYVGKFKQNLEDGEGVLSVPHGDRCYVYDGTWKDGKMNGHGTIKYPNGDRFEGHFKDSQKHGHGMLKQGQLLSSAAHIYVGKWVNNLKQGYGVLDDIRTGEKYLGMWQDDCRQGSGIVVTIDGIYYEGSFVLDKLSGFGIMIFEDGTRFEGELGPEGALNGKGSLYLSNKDVIEGAFYGKWSDGIKISGIYNKHTSCDSDSAPLSPRGSKASCISADSKWEDLFGHCRDVLGMQGLDVNQDNKRAWEAIAVSLAKRRRKESRAKKRWKSFHKDSLDVLERLPEIGSSQGSLTLNDYRQIQLYLSVACDCPDHPIGQLVENIVDVYRASYLGVGAHPRLLSHAAAEVWSFISRIYRIIRVLFLSLPPEGSPIAIPIDFENLNSSDSTDEVDCHLETEVVTPSAVLHPILMPRLYPPLFTLYALHNEKEDELYWKRLLKWNRQSDIALMSFLGVNPKIWLMHISEELLSEDGKRLSSMKEKYFATAVDTLQHISTSFTPMEKLRTIHHAFEEINKEVQISLTQDFIWTMDDLFPVFQYVVVRAQIQHLGAEIHFIDNLMEQHLELGELGIMFTTLKACYFQIRTEKLQQI